MGRKPRKKIALIIGTRPQFIKIALLYPELKKYFDVLLIDTGQHYDYEMRGIFLKQFNLEPNVSLDTVDRVDMELKLIEVLKRENPDASIVVGDTDSTFVGALASVKSGIKLIHIEAGLRSGDKTMPEEINRICVDHLSDVLFAPTQTALDNLKKENLMGYLIGDLQTDVQLHFSNNPPTK